MRLAKCVGLTGPVTVMGSKGSLTIVGPNGQPGDADYHPGWEGDLDQVVGEREGQLETLADHLGAELLKHFVDLESAGAGRRGKRQEAPAAAPQE